ncbi:MAG: bifunctional riboflavin kinase/FAD synthetase [Gammaproteobacteria bacterium]
MELIRHIDSSTRSKKGCVLTIGNFDGLHLGHQAIYRQVRAIAAERGLEAVIMTFEPHSIEYFSPDSIPYRINSIREKILLFSELQIERLVCLRFNNKFAALTAEDFIRRILLDGLNVKAVVVGDDFRFGKNRAGDFGTLQDMGKELGFDVFATETYSIDNERVSSSRIRDALKQGRLDLAEKLLGRPYFLTGRVMHGDKRGRELGFPTANISMRHHKPPLPGIFAVRVRGLSEQAQPAIAYLGTRPTFSGVRLFLEVYIFADPGDIYGRRIKVEFVQHIRFDKAFPTVEELVHQMHIDVIQAKEILAQQSVE